MKSTGPDENRSAASSVPREITESVGAGGQLSGLDQRLLDIVQQRNGRISGEELAKELGVASITPARALQRVREILKSKDALDNTMRKALILQDMIDLKTHLQDVIRGEGGTVEMKDGREVYSFGDPRWSKTLLEVLKEFNRTLERDEENVQKEVMTLRRGNAQLFHGALELTFERFLFILEQRHPEIKVAELREMVEEAIPYGFAVIDARTEQ